MPPQSHPAWKRPPRPSNPICDQLSHKDTPPAFAAVSRCWNLSAKSALVNNPLHLLQILKIHELFAAEHPPCAPPGNHRDKWDVAGSGPCPCSGIQLLHPAVIPRRGSCDLRRCSASCPGCARDAARAASFGILGWSLPSFLTVRKQRPGEKTILSANYHNYSIMAILDEFLMKCAPVISGFRNSQVQPLTFQPFAA